MIAFLVSGLAIAPATTASRSNRLLSCNSLSPPAAEASATYKRPTTSRNESMSFFHVKGLSASRQPPIGLNRFDGLKEKPPGRDCRGGLVSRECLCSLPIGKREHSDEIF